MRVVLVLLCFLCACSASDRGNGKSRSERDSVERQESYGEFLSKGLERANVTSERVKQAMSRVPRHLFVPEDVRELAYEDRALPIGYRQTISQPYIVAIMTQASGADRGSKVLEIGTGSGFQAAVLAELGATVYSVELVPELAERAKGTLQSLGYQEVEVRSGDGFRGWKEHAPYDAILVTAASPVVPPELLGQLAHRGRLVIPLEHEEGEGEGEELMVIERDGENLITRNLGAVRFVPLSGEVRQPSSEVEVDQPGPAFLEEALQGSEPQSSGGESKLETPITKTKKLDKEL